MRTYEDQENQEERKRLNLRRIVCPEQSDEARWSENSRRKNGINRANPVKETEPNLN